MKNYASISNYISKKLETFGDVLKDIEKFSKNKNDDAKEIAKEIAPETAEPA